MSKRIFLMIVAAISATGLFLVHAQGEAPPPAPEYTDVAAHGLAAGPLIATVVYVAIGLILYLIGYVIFDKVMGLDLRKELVEDQNESIGVMMAGVFIGLSIIIAAAIMS